MTTKKIIASIAGTFSIAILFIISFMFFDALSPLTENNPQAQAVLESGQQATINAFNWWLVVGTIGGIIIFVGFIFGIIYAVMKIVENETSMGFGRSFY